MIKKKTKAAKKKVAKKKIAVKKKTTKKAVKKVKPKKKTIPQKYSAIKEKKIGKLTHYFDKIKVIVVKLSDTLSVGDTIHVKGGKETDFKQKIVSMEIDGERVKKAKKGQKIGIKVKDRAREGYKVFKV
jgi:predicted  nucleic acid-binding Zn-ribbon protein